jgi:hypothetical protein
MQSYARGDVVRPHPQRGMVVRSYLDASKGARGLTTWHTPPALNKAAPSNQPNLLFTWPSIHLTGHVEVIENNPEIAPKRGVEISLHDWNAAAPRGRKLEKKKRFFAPSNSLGISGYSVPHKALNLNLSRLHRSSSSGF